MAAASAGVTSCPCQSLGEPTAASVAQAHLVLHQVLLHPVALHSILQHPAESRHVRLQPAALHWSRIPFLFLAVLVQGKGAAFPTSPPWLIWRWQPNVSRVVYSAVAFD